MYGVRTWPRKRGPWPSGGPHSILTFWPVLRFISLILDLDMNYEWCAGNGGNENLVILLISFHHRFDIVNRLAHDSSGTSE